MARIIQSLCIIIALLFTAANAQNLAVKTQAIFENLPPGSFVVSLATALQPRFQPSTTWSFMDKNNLESYFSLRTNGEMRTSNLPLDREKICPSMNNCTIALNVAALTQSKANFVKVFVTIKDMNDEEPTFTPSEVTLTLKENTPKGRKFRLPAATDLDSPKYTISHHTLITHQDLFHLDERRDADGRIDLQLITLQKLDREYKDVYKLEVKAYDKDTPPKQATLKITLTVLDVNDHNPQFERQLYKAVVKEDAQPDHFVAKVVAKDKDSGVNGQVTYSLSEESRRKYGELFTISPNTGVITLRGKLNYELQQSYSLVVTASDNAPNAVAIETSVKINVEDVNDLAPRIELNVPPSPDLSVKLNENSKPGSFVCLVSVEDRDSGQNGQFSCHLNNEDFSVEKVGSSDYKVMTKLQLDREIKERHSLPFICKDRGQPALTSSATITLIVGDENDNVPKCQRDVYSAVLTENQPSGALITTFNCSDKDSGDNGKLSYEISQTALGLFRIDSATAALYTQRQLDYEKQPEIKFTVTVRDNGPISKRRHTTISVIVTLIDVNDEAPKFVTQSRDLSVYENEPSGAIVTVLEVKDADSASFRKHKFSSISAQSPFRIDDVSGAIKTVQSLDRETEERYFVGVRVYDTEAEGLVTTATFTIRVLDRNDNSPDVVYPSNLNNTVHVANRTPKNVVVARIQALDRDVGDNALLSYSMQSGSGMGYFSVDGASGEIMVKEDLASFEQKAFSLHLQVSDNGRPKRSTATILNIVVSSAIPYGPLHHGNDMPNWRTLIIILVVCVVMAIPIIVIIIVMIRKQRYGRGQKSPLPNLLVETPKSSAGSEQKAKNSLIEHEDEFSNSSREQSFNSSSRDGSRRKKEVSFSDAPRELDTESTQRSSVYQVSSSLLPAQ